MDYKQRLFFVLSILLYANFCFADNFYWVGNSGNWKDASHWSYSSGGVSNGKIPTSKDDVFFDHNSFSQESIITVHKSAFCHDFNWSSNKKVILRSSEKAKLKIDGSFLAKTLFQNEFYGKILFTSNNVGNHISAGNNTFSGKIELNGNGGWLLDTDLTAKSSLFVLKKGSIDLKGKTLSVKSFQSIGKKPKQLNLSNSNIKAETNWQALPSSNLDFITNENSILFLPEENVNKIFHEEGSEIDYTKSKVVNNKTACNTAAIPFHFTSFIKTDYNTFGVSCIDSCDAILSVRIDSGGVGPFTFDWIGGPSDSLWENVCQGTYNVIVFDQGQGGAFCVSSPPISVTEPPEITTIQLSYVEPTCNGDCDGEIGILALGGVGGFTYDWTNTGGTTPTETMLCAGNYPLIITDANDCKFDTTFALEDPDPIAFDLDSIDVSCFGNCNGSAISSNVTGGNGTPYSFSWNTIPAQTTPTASNLCAGIYTLTITDAMLCSTKDSIEVNIPAQLSLDTSHINVKCGGECSGSITVNVLGGGTGPFTHHWSNGTIFTGTNAVLPDLCVGTYKDSIVDANGCDTVLSFTITEPDTLLTTSSFSDVSCFKACDGNIKTTPQNGTPPYTYSWNTIPIQTTDSIFDLCPDEYIIDITDFEGCTVSDTIVITEPDSLETNMLFTDVDCNGNCTGTASSAPIGGVLPYDYSWSNGESTQSINGLCPGSYTLTLTDDNDCIAVGTVEITAPDPIAVNPSATNINCGAICDGTATANPTGGESPYTYLWDNGDVTQTTTTGLCDGRYGIKVTDKNNCSVIDSVTISSAIAITVLTDTIEISCNGVCDGEATATPVGGVAPYTYLWDDPSAQTTPTATGLCPGTYNVTVTDDNNCSKTVSITMPTAPDVLVPNGSVQHTSCFGDCDGIVFSAPSGGTPPYVIDWSVPDTTDLCPGDYTVTVTDDNNCIQEEILTVMEPDPIDINPTITHIGCNSGTTGSISTAAAGGTPFTSGPSYTYLWTPNGETSSSITNLNAGSYGVTITDSLGCSSQAFFTVTEPSDLAAIPIGINITCNGDNNGVAAVVVGGGNPPYTYNWSPGGETTDSIFNLGPGIYSVLITDSSNCTISESITITEPDPLVTNTSGTTVGCNGTCTGSASSTPTGGTSPYSYSWDTSPAETTSSITDLCTGTYTVVVTDDNGCSSNGDYTVTTPTQLDVTLDSTNVTCTGADDGTATATPTGGTPPYDYNWIPGNLTTPTINNLSPQIYTLTVTDDFGCFYIGSVTIEEPSPIVANETIVDATCGLSDGSISLSPTGGTSPYTHSWSTGSTNSSITNLGVGFYSDTITDFNGCEEIVTFGISNPNGPSGVISTIIDATCFGVCNGSANVIPIGGTPGYSYDWNVAGETDSTITDQCAGVLNLTITDAVGCVLNTSVTIGQADSIIGNPISTNPSCDGICDGTASVSPSGGTTPYTYLWSNGAMTQSVSGLCAGPLSVTITDFNGCAEIIHFNLSAPDALTIATSSTDVKCNGACDGIVTAAPGGGTAPYSYLWNDPLSHTTSTVNNLCAGTYEVVVTDFNGCISSESIIVDEPSIILANEVTRDALCNDCNGGITLNPSGGIPGYTYEWDDFPGFTGPSINALCASTYMVEITDLNNCTQNFSVAVSNIGGPTITVNTDNATCEGFCDGEAAATVTSGNGPYTYLWTGNPGGQTTSAVTGLCEGIYTVEVTDVNNCITVESIGLTDNTLLNASITTTPASCNGICDGSAIIVPSSGIPPYSYNWSTGDASNAVAGLCGGTYMATVTDVSGCSITETVVINEPSVLSVSTSGIDASCGGVCEGVATATPSGGTAPYTYLWSNGKTTATINTLCPQAYTVLVTDANGCTSSGSVVIGDGANITANVSTTDAVCGQCDGTASVITGGGGTPYTYTWFPSNQTTATVNNLCPGTYTLEITDNDNCSKEFTVLINNPNGPSLSTVSDSIDCFGNCDATAFTTVNSGNPPYSYQWDDPSLQNIDTAKNLCSGLYSITVRDNNGCITIDTISVYEPEQISANIASTPISCYGFCDGIVTANTIGGTGSYSYTWNTSPAQSTPSATGLCAGTYAVTITDDNLCSIVDSVTLLNPDSISATITLTNVTCNNDCDATAQASVSGGAAPYIYSWSTNPVQTNNLAIGLCASTDTLTVTDKNGCASTNIFSIANPSVLSTTSSATNTSCSNSCDGSITTNPSGGVAPYTYIWDDGQTTQTATGLCAGTYTVTVVDASGCSTTDEIDITSPVVIDDGTVVTNPTCGLTDGEATANPTGGSGSYAYLWGDGQTTQTATGLAAGTLTLEITDQGTGCSYNYTILINNSNGPTVSTTFTNETCVNACDGSASADVSGGNSPYTYSWNTTPTQNTQSVANLCIGNYMVTVTDDMGCITTDTFTITTNGLDLSVTNIIPETCFESCDGSATVIAKNGNSPYTYSWNSNPVQTTDIASDLCSDTYVATVTDNLNCSDAISTVISGPDLLDATIIVANSITCNGNASGSLTANTNGGTGGYTYLWSNGQTTPTISNLTAGTYVVSVTDANDCMATDSITLEEPSPILANETMVLPNCNICDGKIEINPSGGNGPYTFQWSTGDQGIAISGLCADPYSLDITDIDNCTKTFHFPLSNINAPDITLEVTPITCNGLTDGKITAVPSGGTPPYVSYQWTPSAQSTPTATNLSADVYSVKIIDNLGCAGIATDSIIEPEVLLANIEAFNISCFGLCDGLAIAKPSGGTLPYKTAVWMPGSITNDTITALCAGIYHATVMDSNNCVVQDSVEIIEPTPITSSFSTTDASCSSNCDGEASLISTSGGIGPYDYLWSPGNQPIANAEGLCFGTNTVTVTDQNNCDISVDVDVGAVDTITADAGTDTTVCSGTSVNLEGTKSGNVNSTQWLQLPDLEVVGTKDTVLAPPTIGTTCYLFQVSGTCDVFDTVCITVNPAPTITTGPDVLLVEGASTALSASGGNSYSWSPGASLSDSTIANPVATPSETTTYYVTVESEDGCIGTDSINVDVVPTIVFSDGLTPNGDGKNDVWIIEFIEEFPNNVVEVYNRWGELIFHADGYQQDFDGTYNGKELPIGTYYYIIDLNDERTTPVTGPITILR